MSRRLFCCQLRSILVISACFTSTLWATPIFYCFIYLSKKKIVFVYFCVISYIQYIHTQNIRCVGFSWPSYVDWFHSTELSTFKAVLTFNLKANVKTALCSIKSSSSVLFSVYENEITDKDQNDEKDWNVSMKVLIKSQMPCWRGFIGGFIAGSFERKGFSSPMLLLSEVSNLWSWHGSNVFCQKQTTAATGRSLPNKSHCYARSQIF